MRRGTTPTFRFSTPYRADQVEGGWITIMQRGVVVYEKDLASEGAEIKDYIVILNLTQEETLRFSEAEPTAKAQIRLNLISGKATASNIVEFFVDEILKEGTI